MTPHPFDWLMVFCAFMGLLCVLAVARRAIDKIDEHMETLRSARANRAHWGRM